MLKPNILFSPMLYTVKMSIFKRELPLFNISTQATSTTTILIYIVIVFNKSYCASSS